MLDVLVLVRSSAQLTAHYNVRDVVIRAQLTAHHAQEHAQELVLMDVLVLVKKLVLVVVKINV